jgi:hypothetical protein
MIYDLSLGLSWPPDVVRRLTVDDLKGLARAADRRERRSKKGRR